MFPIIIEKRGYRTEAIRNADGGPLCRMKSANTISFRLREITYNRPVQRFFERLGFAFCIAAGAICVVLHVATFVTVVPRMWIFLPFAFIFGALLCSKAGGSDRRFGRPNTRAGLLAVALFLYAVLTFVYVYRTTGGASSVSMLDGKYVAMDKSHVIRTISIQEYQMFPNLWARVMSAWIGMMSAVGLLQMRLTE